MKEKDMPKAYEPAKFEDNIYKKWEESGKFNPDNYELDENSGTFTIMLPPPNVTGVLHLGHASMLAYQDLMIRYNRMLGKRTLWLPGTDHAAIATQTKVEKIILKEEGKTRHDMTREELLERINKFAQKSKTTINSQMRKMGASVDWSRERYTMDGNLNNAVTEMFTRMYNDGLIYRGDRIVNWCPRCHSSLADDEVEHTNRNTKFYTFKYNKDFPISISTTRPETKLADTAVAVHPSDERYKKYIGKTYDVDFAGGVKLKLKIISDYHVDKDFGTGALGVTPAHSMADAQIALDNDLPTIKLINEDGKITDNGGSFAGIDVLEARKKVVEWLRENDLIEEEKDISQNLSICYRCDHAIEPLPSLQWFVSVDKEIKFPDGKSETLKQRAIRVVKGGDIEIIPNRFNKVYYDWMENLHDWCISRQIIFGHRIPVWYRGEEIYVGKMEPEGEGWVKETDTLDTWFSSGQWTYATLGWPMNVKQDTVAEHYEEKNDLERFHPTSVLETGYDILFFWVARMILMTNYALGEVPFEKVYLHGMVRDKQGRKMSKSLDNVIDPLVMINKFGTDALRLSMIIGSTPGNDLKLYEDKIEGYRNFVNKLYNIARYILTNVKEVKRVNQKPEPKTLADEWILNEMDKLIYEVTDKIEKYQFSHAGESLRDFTWNILADWYIEIAKIENDPSTSSGHSKDEILLYLLEKILILWHPLIPFVTEHIWEKLETEEMLMVQPWPRVIKEDIKEVPFDLIQEVIATIRNLRGENKIEPALKLKCVIVSQYDKQIQEQEEIIKKLARLEDLKVLEHLDERPHQSAVGVFGEGSMVYLLLEGVIDINAEKNRLEKEIDEAYKVLTSSSGKLENKSFITNAPAEVVEGVKETFSNAQDKLEKLKTQLESLK